MLPLHKSGLFRSEKTSGNSIVLCVYARARLYMKLSMERQFAHSIPDDCFSLNAFIARLVLQLKWERTEGKRSNTEKKKRGKSELILSKNANRFRFSLCDNLVWTCSWSSSAGVFLFIILSREMQFRDDVYVTQLMNYFFFFGKYSNFRFDFHYYSIKRLYARAI